MDVDAEIEEIRWKLIKTMLDEFPNLRAKTRSYLKERK